MNLGPTELVLVLVIVLLLFGASRLPRLARSLGQTQHEFRRGLKSDLDPLTGDTERIEGTEER